MICMKTIAEKLSEKTQREVSFVCFEDDNRILFSVKYFKTYDFINLNKEHKSSVLLNGPHGTIVENDEVTDKKLDRFYSGYNVYTTHHCYPEQIEGFLSKEQDIVMFLEKGYTQNPINIFESYLNKPNSMLVKG